MAFGKYFLDHIVEFIISSSETLSYVVVCLSLFNLTRNNCRHISREIFVIRLSCRGGFLNFSAWFMKTVTII